MIDYTERKHYLKEMTPLEALDLLDEHICDYLSRLREPCSLYCEDNGDSELITNIRDALEKLEDIKACL